MQHGFTHVGAERISARTLRDNVASQRVMEKCGLRRAGEFVYAADVIAGSSEQERAAVKYVLTRDDWLQQQAHGVR